MRGRGWPAKDARRSTGSPYDGDAVVSDTFHTQGRPHRLPDDAYAALDAVCLITICTRDRQPVFRNAQLAQMSVDVLRAQAAEQGIALYAFCIMPDHVHMVIGPSARCDILTYVRRFKGFAVRASWRLGFRGTFWQSSFHDRMRRANESADEMLNYVLRNPVDAGLVKEWQEYPFSGAPIFENWIRNGTEE